ncbi:hypothetical protein ACIBQ1_51230 [Nonomuraea sp. NPDC050153]|uniref:hypothetical protein n=1 Tax=Nonomuraea sp. NPDC050153 TaxID=3364359 RepID=UPI003788C74A
MGERLEIHRQVVVGGVARWTDAAVAARDKLAEAAARIESLHAAAPWGRDSAGREFERAYLADDGPNVLLRTGAELTGFAVSAGTAVTENVRNSESAAADLGTTKGLEGREKPA